MATKLKGKSLSKKQIKVLEKCIKDPSFSNEVLLRTQILGSHLLRILDAREKQLYINLDGEYYIYNTESQKSLQYNTDTKNQIECKEDLEKLYKEVS